MNKHVLIAPMLGVGALAIFGFDAVQGRHQQSALQRIHAEVSSLTNSVERLQHTQRNAVAQGFLNKVAAPVPRVNPQERAPQAAPVDSAPPRESTTAHPPDVAKVRDLLETSFTGEQPDPQWVAQAQSTAKTKLTEAMPDTSSVRSIACRSSMCRIETIHEDVQHYQEFVQRAFLNPETKVWNGGFFSTPLTAPGNGKLVVVSYLARDGADLPANSSAESAAKGERPE
jgi:hypothetical protein